MYGTNRRLHVHGKELPSLLLLLLLFHIEDYDQQIVTVAEAAFVHATPLLAEIEQRGDFHVTWGFADDGYSDTVRISQVG